MHVLLGERDEIELKVNQFASDRKQELCALSEVAETQDYEKLFLSKVDLTLQVQAYFLNRLDASDLRSIQELIRVFCKNYGQVLEGEVLISPILAGEPYEYLEYSIKNKKSLII